MLRITARANDIKYDTIARKYLNDDNVFVQEGSVFTDGDSIKVPVSSDTAYSVSSTIYFERKDGSDIDWSAVTFVNTISDGFYFANMLNDVRIDYDSAELKEISIKPGETASQALVLHLKRGHDYIKNRDDVFVSGRIGCTMGDIQIDDSEYGCVGDYLVYNNNFLYKVKRVSSSGKYAMSSADFQNYETTVWYEEDGEKVLFRAVVPCTLGGKDIRDTIEPQLVLIVHRTAGDIADDGTGHHINVMGIEQDDAVADIMLTLVALDAQCHLLVGIVPNALQGLHVGLIEPHTHRIHVQSV